MLTRHKLFVPQNHVYEEHTSTLQLYWSDREWDFIPTRHDRRLTRYCDLAPAGDVITFLAERGDDEHLNKVKKLGDHHASLEVSTRGQDESALFDDDEESQDEEETEEIVVKARKLTQAEEKASVQRSKSAAKTSPVFEGLRTHAAGGHRIQDIRELMKVPVIVSADLEKSPPVIKVVSCNAFRGRRLPSPPLTRPFHACLHLQFAVNPYAAKK